MKGHRLDVAFALLAEDLVRLETGETVHEDLAGSVFSLAVGGEVVAFAVPGQVGDVSTEV